MSDLINKIRKDFKDKEYRHNYIDEFLNAWIATQIKVLREQREWSQKQLAEYSGMAQPRISALENVNYSSWSVTTLRRLAEAFDLTLRISFESFADRIKDFDLFSREYLQRTSFDEDPRFNEMMVEAQSPVNMQDSTERRKVKVLLFDPELRNPGADGAMGSKQPQGASYFYRQEGNRASALR